MKFKAPQLVMQEAPDAGGGSAGGLGSEPAEAEELTPEVTPDENVDMSGVPEWAHSLEVDKDILLDPSLKAINDVNSVAKSYVHAQRKIGQKGVLLPNENSTQEEWDTFYQKTGVPLEEQDYISKVEFAAEGEQLLGQTFNEGFIKKAHELRIRPDQATQMYQFFSESAKSSSENFSSQIEEQRQEGLNQLRDSLGEDAYNVQLTKASQLIKEELGDEFSGYLQETGLGKDPKVVGAFMKLATKFYKEDPIPTGQSRSGMTKDEMQAEINNALGNFDDPYHKPNHPDHKRRVKEVQNFFAKMEGRR